VLGETRNTAGRRVPFQHAFCHSLAERRGRFSQGSLGIVEFLVRDGGMDFLDQALHRAQRRTVSRLALHGLAGSTNRRFVDDGHGKLLYKGNVLLSQGSLKRQDD